MCGIWGVISPDRKDAFGFYMSRAFSSLAHRGPDGKGSFRRGNVLFGHTRLKVLDMTERAAQPMESPDGQVVLSYNGEVFNFLELKEALVAKGYVFRSDSDTEVALYAYMEWGEGCFQRFNGMFAVVLADYHRGKVIAAVDRFGIKPLYYLKFKGQIFFASEMKVFLDLQEFSPRLDPEVLGEVLTYRCLNPGRTLVEGVGSLEGGNVMTVDMADPTRMKKRPYWELQPQDCSSSYDAAGEELLCLLKDSLRLRKVCDVPHGIMLSGGVDSSLLVALDREMNRDTPMTFSVGFDQPAYDERPYSEFVSKKFGTRHRNYVFSDRDVVEAYRKCVWHLEDPINHPHTPLLYLISREVKKHVTVLLTGEASDEIFAGYSRHRVCRDAVNQGADPVQTVLRSSALMAPEVLERLLVDQRCLASLELRRELIEKAGPLSFLQRLQYYDIKTYLPSLLMRLDKMTMAASVESRLPFMDYRLVEFAFSLPDAFKIRNQSTKAILKDVAMNYFPHDFTHRKKVGFRTPFREWIRNQDYFRQLLFKKASPLDVYVDQGYVREVGERFFNGEDSFECSDVVWSVINLKLWCILFMEGEVPVG